MPLFKSGQQAKELKERESELEAHSKLLTLEIGNEEKLYQKHESEMKACEDKMRLHEVRAEKADAARKEARASLDESRHVLAVRRGEEEAQCHEEVWVPQLLAADTRAMHITEEKVILKEELEISKRHNEEHQERLVERREELEEGVSRARNIHGPLSAQISKAQTQLAALHLEASFLETRHAEEVLHRDKAVRQNEESEQMLEMERQEGDRLTGELQRLRVELRGMWADYWESLPYMDVGMDLGELQKLQEVERQSADRAATLEWQLKAERERRQDIYKQGQFKCAEFRKQIRRLQQTNGAFTSGFFKTTDSPKHFRAQRLPQELASPTQTPDLKFPQEISWLDGSHCDSSIGGQRLKDSQHQSPSQDFQLQSPGTVSLRRENMFHMMRDARTPQLSQSDYARGPHNPVQSSPVQSSPIQSGAIQVCLSK